MRTSFKQFMSESIEDKGIFKAIFVIGIPGAGKSYTVSKMNGAVTPRVVNTDRATEYLAKKFGKMIAALVEEEGVNEKMAEFINPLAYLGDQMGKFTTELGFKGFQNPDEVGAAAVDYLRVAGHLVYGYFWARMAQVALREIAAGNDDPFYKAKLQTARFYFAKLFPETATLMRTARTGAKVLLDTDEALA